MTQSLTMFRIRSFCLAITAHTALSSLTSGSMHAQECWCAPFFATLTAVSCPAALSQVADVGCGCGEALMAVAAAFPNCACTGFDIAEDALR